MTENEVIKSLEYAKRIIGLPEQEEKWSANREIIAIDIAIKALEEIQQYRAIGTVEECVLFKGISEKDLSTSCLDLKTLKELHEYKKIGTVEECQEAAEKQKPKKSKHQGTYDSDGVWHEWNGINGRPYELCPNCGKNLYCEIPYEKKPKHCGECGQMLDWIE